MTPGVYIGALSGTSMDALDVAAVRFSPWTATRVKPELLACANEAIPESLRDCIYQLQQENASTITQAEGEHYALGRLFAGAVSRLIKKLPEHETVRAVGLHGQTVLHRPYDDPPFTLQIGDPSVVATQTNCTVVSDFRQYDLAAKGCGAPLAPVFHQAFFAETGETQSVVNIGGIANITLLEGDKLYSGFDCGPGNILLDTWTRSHCNRPYDRDGAWAQSGTCDEALLSRFLEDEFFSRPPPKVACATDFSLAWVDQKLAGNVIAPENVQATLTELTARCIADAVSAFRPPPVRILVCGGGIHNRCLVGRLKTLLKVPISDTQAAGFAPDWVEAAGFAYLAGCCLDNKKIDLRNVTGAHEPVILGKIYRR